MRQDLVRSPLKQLERIWKLTTIGTSQRFRAHYPSDHIRIGSMNHFDRSAMLDYINGMVIEHDEQSAGLRRLALTIKSDAPKAIQ